LELRASDLEYELKRARHVCFSGQLPSDHMPVHVPLDKALRQYDDIKDRLRDVEETLFHKKGIKSQIEKRMIAFDGLEYQVMYKRDIEGKYLDQIADELGYSHAWIKKVSMRVKREPQRNLAIVK
jgi:hypothetical protein